MTDTGAASRSTSSLGLLRARAACRALAATLLFATPALAQDVAAQAQAAPVADPDPVLLQVGDSIERLSDIGWRFDVAVRSYLSGQGVPYSPEMAAQLIGLMPSYLEQRASEVVLLREAARRQLVPNQESIDGTLERIRSTMQEGDDYETVLAAAGFASEDHLLTLIRESDLISQVISAISGEVEPTDVQVSVRYRADIAAYTQPESYCARHILVADEAVAAAIVADVQGGADFAALAAEHGTDATASRGGDLGCFGLGRMVAPFEEAVVAATVGEVSGPVQSEFGYHAILVYQHDDARVLPLAEVEDQVRESVKGSLVDAHINGLLRGAAATTYPERIPVQ
jgi:peptidyl-prolyl cis-trans isomerase C